MKRKEMKDFYFYSLKLLQWSVKFYFKKKIENWAIFQSSIFTLYREIFQSKEFKGYALYIIQDSVLTFLFSESTVSRSSRTSVRRRNIFKKTSRS